MNLFKKMDKFAKAKPKDENRTIIGGLITLSILPFGFLIYTAYLIYVAYTGPSSATTVSMIDS
jgi:hypothetical protein